MTDLRWAVLGTGRIAMGVAPKLDNALGCHLSCIASRTAERAREAARELEHDHPVSPCDDKALLERTDIDAVYVTVPNHLHTKWCIALLESGKHVLCEKPLCASEAEARAIFDAAKRAKRLCTEGFMYLHHPQTQRLAEIAQDPNGPIGNLKEIRAWRDVRMTDPHILSTRLSHAMQGGALMDVGCYPVSIARYLAGEEPGDDLTAEGMLAQPLPGESSSVDQMCQFKWTFPSGVTCIGGTSIVSDHKVLLELIGDKGTVTTTYPFSPDLPEAPPVDVNGVPEWFADAGDKFVLQFERFARAVRGEVEPLPSPQWSIGQARTIERLRKLIGLRFDVDEASV